MSLSHRQKKAVALLILCIGLPVYVGAALWIVSLFERPHMLVEFGIYALAGVLWALPFKSLFRGIGAADPNQPSAEARAKEE